MAQKRASQIPTNEFLDVLKEVVLTVDENGEANPGTKEDFVALIQSRYGERSPDSISTRISQLKDKYPAVGEWLEAHPFKSSGVGGGRKSIVESDLMALLNG